MIDVELSRAFGKAMKVIKYKGNCKELRDELLNAKSLDDLSNECREIVENIMKNDN